MTTLAVKDANGDTKYLEMVNTGSVGDPFNPVQSMEQATHNNLNCNANIQVGDADVANGNPVPVSDAGGSLTVDLGAAIPAGTNNIGDVDVLSIAAGENHVGQTGKGGTVVDVTLTLDTNIYADGDVLSDTAAVTAGVRVNAGKGILRSLVVVDADDQGAALDLYFFDGNVSLGTKNSAPTISDADALYILGKVAVAGADYYDLGGVRVVTKSDLNILVKGATGSTSFYVSALSRGTGTYTANGIKLRLAIEQF